MPLRAQHGSFRDRLDTSDWSIATTTGGSLTASTTRFFWVQLVNLVGKNLLSIPKSITANAGEKIVLTLNTSIAREGESVFAILISASHTNDEATATQVAILNYLSSDWLSTANLPATIEFSEDAHVEIDNLVVATAANLPSGSDLLNGMVREITDENKYYVYDGEEDVWEVLKFSSFITQVTETDLSEGADQLIGAAPLFTVPKKEAGIDSVRVRYWLLNGFEETGDPVVKADTSLNFIIYVNGEPYIENNNQTIWYNQIFDGLIKFELVGYYRYLNAAFDSGMYLAGVEQIWSPSSLPKSVLTLTQDLPSGWAAVVDIWLSFSELSLQNRGIQETDVIGIEFDLPRNFAPRSALTNAIGDNTVLGALDRLLVLPNKVFAGRAIINGNDVAIDEQDLEGLSEDTDNQLVVINSSTSTVRLVQPGDAIYADEVVRASASTLGGRTNPSPVSNTITLTSPQSLQIELTHPVISNRATIRGDYDDILIANSPLAFWDNPDLRLAIAHDSTLYEANYTIAADSSASQTIEINSLADFVEVGFLPQVDSDFGLYSPQAATISTVGTSGTLPDGEYKVFWVYEYPSPNNLITKISHDPDFLSTLTATPPVKTLPSDFDELTKPKIWSNDILPTVADARLLTATDLLAWRVWKLGSRRIPYHFNPTNNEADDGITTIRPTAIATGALEPVPTLGIKVANAFTIFPPHTIIKVGAGLVVAEDIAEDAVVISLDGTAISPLESIESLYTSNGQVLQASDGSIIY